MAVVIRLQRIGKPHQPYYRIVTIDTATGVTQLSYWPQSTR